MLIFAASVPAFSFSSITALLWCPQRLGYYNDHMHVEFAHCAVTVNHNACSF